MGFFRFALAVLVVRARVSRRALEETTTAPPEEEKGNCQTIVYHFGHEKGDMLYECPEDKPVPKDLKPTGDVLKPFIAAVKSGKKEDVPKAWLEMCCPASMVGFAVFSLLL